MWRGAANSRGCALQPTKRARRGGVRACLLQEQLFERLPVLAHLVHRYLLDELTSDNNSDMRAKALDDLQHVRGQENGRSTMDVAGEQVADNPRGHGVHAFERLVEEQQVWV